ncbi:MAG: AAA family ATPase [Beijerinckiaceae bacterium]|nr:AAA family ATPase [Beijerinckiaceae bacterium]
MTQLSWSPQQDAALTSVATWLRDGAPGQVFRLFGYAGTGKTTLAKHFAEGLPGKVLYGAFTGKAASVMRKKGCHGASTIHSMIYRTDTDEYGRTIFRLNPDGIACEAELIIIDECSMVGPDLGRDLLSYGKPVLVLGDPAQLPPVNGAGFFTDKPNPDVLLTEIHRQALENPIIRMSIDVREGHRLEFGDHGAAKVIKRSDLDPKSVLAADIVLCGMNKTRRAFNNRIRERKGITQPGPQRGEKLVCLKNKRDKGLLNGTLWTVEKQKRSAAPWLQMVVKPEDEPDVTTKVDIKVNTAFFNGTEDDLDENELRLNEHFTFGYCLTVHKSQGSQWDDVMLFDESGVFRNDARRWLYTGLTRAAERLTIVRAV